MKNEQDSNYYKIMEMTHVEKVKMYRKLSKSELIEMLIESNRQLWNIPPVVSMPSESYETVFSDLCSCNPKNGGSGVYGCTLGNMIVKRNTYVPSFYCNGDCSKTTGGCTCNLPQTTTVSVG